MLEPIEGGSSRDRQARSKASDAVLTPSSASTARSAPAVARAKAPPILRPLRPQNPVKLPPTSENQNPHNVLFTIV